MATTTNFGWTTPDDTDLVKDGAAAIRTLGSGIDTSLVDLKGGTTGQVLSKASNTDLDYSWTTPNVGDITEVQAGTGISIADGTGPIPVITNTVATEFDAKGDLIVGTGADTFDRLAVGTDGYTLVADSAETTGLKWQAPASGSTFAGCSLYGDNPGNFEVSAGASVLITWNLELFDTDGYHSTSSNTDRITIPSGKAGYYLINAAIEWDDDNAVATCGIRVYLNGSEIARRYFLRSDNGGRTASDVQAVRNLAVGDYLQVYAYSETAQGAYHYAPNARFEVALLGT